MDVIAKLTKRLQERFKTGQISVTSSDNRHFKAVVHSSEFKDVSLVNQHRLVYETVLDMLSNECHALNIETKEIEEK